MWNVCYHWSSWSHAWFAYTHGTWYPFPGLKYQVCLNKEQSKIKWTGDFTFTDTSMNTTWSSASWVYNLLALGVWELLCSSVGNRSSNCGQSALFNSTIIGGGRTSALQTDSTGNWQHSKTPKITQVNFNTNHSSLFLVESGFSTWTVCFFWRFTCVTVAGLILLMHYNYTGDTH